MKAAQGSAHSARAVLLEVFVAHAAELFEAGGDGGVLALLLHLLHADEMIVFANVPPRSSRNLAHIHEAPVTAGHALEAEVVADGGGDVDAGTVVVGVLRAGSAEDIVVVVGDEGAAVFPLGVADAVAVADGHPLAF